MKYMMIILILAAAVVSVRAQSDEMNNFEITFSDIHVIMSNHHHVNNAGEMQDLAIKSERFNFGNTLLCEGAHAEASGPDETIIYEYSDQNNFDTLRYKALPAENKLEYLELNAKLVRKVDDWDYSWERSLRLEDVPCSISGDAIEIELSGDEITRFLKSIRYYEGRGGITYGGYSSNAIRHSYQQFLDLPDQRPDAQMVIRIYK